MTLPRPSLSGSLAGLSRCRRRQHSTPAAAAARTTYDGNWSVLIVTNSGPCDRGYRYGLSIRNGAVFYEGSAAVNVAGQVSGNGTVKVRVWAGRRARTAPAGFRANTAAASGAAPARWATLRRHLDRRTALNLPAIAQKPAGLDWPAGLTSLRQRRLTPPCG